MLELAKLVRDNQDFLKRTKNIVERINKLRVFEVLPERAIFVAGVLMFGIASKAVEAIIKY